MIRSPKWRPEYLTKIMRECDDHPYNARWVKEAYDKLWSCLYLSWRRRKMVRPLTKSMNCPFEVEQILYYRCYHTVCILHQLDGFIAWCLGLSNLHHHRNAISWVLDLMELIEHNYHSLVVYSRISNMTLYIWDEELIAKTHLSFFLFDASIDCIVIQTAVALSTKRNKLCPCRVGESARRWRAHQATNHYLSHQLTLRSSC